MAQRDGDAVGVAESDEGLYGGLIPSSSDNFVDSIEVDEVEDEGEEQGASHPATLAMSRRTAGNEAAAVEQSDDKLMEELRQANTGMVNTRIADRESDVSFAYCSDAASGPIRGSSPIPHFCLCCPVARIVGSTSHVSVMFAFAVPKKEVPVC